MHLLPPQRSHACLACYTLSCLLGGIWSCPQVDNSPFLGSRLHNVRCVFCEILGEIHTGSPHMQPPVNVCIGDVSSVPMVLCMPVPDMRVMYSFHESRDKSSFSILIGLVMILCWSALMECLGQRCPNLGLNLKTIENLIVWWRKIWFQCLSVGSRQSTRYSESCQQIVACWIFEESQAKWVLAVKSVSCCECIR